MEYAIELIKYLTPAISIVATILIIVIKWFEYFNRKLESQEKIKGVDKEIAGINRFNKIIDNNTYYGSDAVQRLLFAIKGGSRLHGSDIDEAIKILTENKSN